MKSPCPTCGHGVQNDSCFLGSDDIDAPAQLKCPQCELDTVYWDYVGKQLICNIPRCGFHFRCEHIEGLDGKPTSEQATQILTKAKERYMEYIDFLSGKNNIQIR